ncbi:phospholipid-binding protein MlaC [Thalassotalea euphylliae]|uniref:MlaC/ttg2D family ABC transporter substrate-binding protein n=1 Tax=Thalassotalea euphylliae TaxID=1655234 RepID=UPI00363C5FC7
MKSFVLGVVFLLVSGLSNAAQTPTKVVEAAVSDIIAIAGNKALGQEEKVEGLNKAIDTYVDINASGARVLAKYARGADKEELKTFLGLYKQVLINTYSVLLEKYENEEVLFDDEQIKKEKYATVDTTVISGDKKIPVSYRLIFRKDEWKIYDFVAEGISMTRSFAQQYQKILKKDGIGGLNTVITEKLNEPKEAS